MYLNKKELQTFERVASKMVSKSGIFSLYKIEFNAIGIILSVTDLKKSLVASIPYNYSVECNLNAFSDEFTIKASSFKAILNLVGKSILVSKVDDSIYFDTIKLIFDECTDYPLIQTYDDILYEGNIFNVGELVHIAKFISDDELRPYTCGVFLDGTTDILSCAVTDGRVLALDNRIGTVISSKEGATGFSIIVPSIHLLNEFKVSEISYTVPEENIIEFNSGNFKLSIACIEGSFPSYRRVIPLDENCSYINIKSDDILAGLKEIRNKAAVAGIKLSKNEPIVLSVNNVEFKNYEGLSSDISFHTDTIFCVNRRYLENVLEERDGIFPHFQIRYSIGVEYPPLVFTPLQFPTALYVVMPMVI